MASPKRHFPSSSWPEKNRETLRFTALLCVIFCTVWFLSLPLPTFSPPTHTATEDHQIPETTTSEPMAATCHGGFSIYMYDLPSEFNLGLLLNCSHLNVYTDMCPHVANRGLGQPFTSTHVAEEEAAGGGVPAWFATHQFIGEMIFHARVENHPCRTWEPEKAELFYVPFYGGLHASSMFREQDHKKRDDLAVRLVDYVRSQPWWGRHNGQDHFLALGRTAWDFMRTDGVPDFGANVLLNLPPVKNMSVLTVERQPWQGSNQFGIPYPSYFHPSTSAQMLTWQNKVRQMDRPHLFSFVGGPRKGLEKAAIRDQLIRQCAESRRCELLKCHSGNSRCHDPSVVLTVMSRSQFCLQAPGDSFTRRSTFDAILAGCIPVFFSPHTAYTQYAWYFPGDSKSYSVFMDEGKTWRIEEELSKITKDQVERMRETVIGLIPRLTYAHPNATGYDLRDVVDVALEALAKNVKSRLGS